MTTLDRKKEWWLKKAEREGGVTVGAGVPETAPRGPCLACGHVHDLAAWDYNYRASGICRVCLELMVTNRGHCSPERGCFCEEKP